MIPTARALIGWSYTNDRRHVTRVIVIEQPAPGQDTTDGLGPREWRELDCTHGACCHDWLQGSPAMTPEGVFGDMLAGDGFASPQHARKALEAFAKIEGCGWARAMLAGSPAGG